MNEILGNTLQVPAGTDRYKKVEIVESVCIDDIQDPKSVEIFIKTGGNLHRIFYCDKEKCWKLIPSIGGVEYTIPPQGLAEKIEVVVEKVKNQEGKGFLYQKDVRTMPAVKIFKVYSEIKEHDKESCTLPIAEEIDRYYKRSFAIGVVPTKIS